MNIEIRDAALEARIKRQPQATGSASVEEVLARLLETQEEQDRRLLENWERSRQRSGSESSNPTAAKESPKSSWMLAWRT